MALAKQRRRTRFNISSVQCSEATPRSIAAHETKVGCTKVWHRDLMDCRISLHAQMSPGLLTSKMLLWAAQEGPERPSANS